MNEAIETLKEISKDEKIIGLYDAEAVERKVWNSRLYYAKKEGKEEGQQEKAIEIAKNMLNKGIDIKDIIEITELSKEEIENLKS